MRRALVVMALVACALLGATACGSSKKATPLPAPTDARGKPTFEIDAKNNQAWVALDERRDVGGPQFLQATRRRNAGREGRLTHFG